MSSNTRRFIFTAVVMAGASVATAQTSSPDAGSSQPGAVSGAHQRNSTSTQASVSADTFIKKASQDGMTEVKVAALAEQKSQSEDVRRFAAQMERDHTKANSELESIATSKHIPVSSTLDSEHQAMLSELTGKSGQAFDAAYSSHMVAAHKKAVALFQSGAHSQDADIAKFAAKTLPTLEHHKGMADELAAKRKLTAAGAPGATG